jgi:predicted nuclease with RNAse H fold
MKYIGIDLAGWGNDKTRIVIGKQEGEKLVVQQIIKESDISKEKTFEAKNNELFNYLLTQIVDEGYIGIDAPFSPPLALHSEKESLFIFDDIPNDLANPYLFNNDARFAYLHHGKKMLPPMAGFLGYLTTRMVHIIDHFSDKIDFIRGYREEIGKGIKAVEVYPAGTLYHLGYEASYKGKAFEQEKVNILRLIASFIEIDLKMLKSDDDMDAVIAMLTVWMIKNIGYIHPEEVHYFKKSFSYIPDFVLVK